MRLFTISSQDCIFVCIVPVVQPVFWFISCRTFPLSTLSLLVISDIFAFQFIILFAHASSVAEYCVASADVFCFAPLYSKCPASHGIPALYHPFAFKILSCSGVTASSFELPYTSIAIPLSWLDFQGSAT